MYLLMHNVELKPAELAARDDLRHQLEITFRRIFKNCRVRMYGSSANTFGVRGSDIDAFLDLNLDSPESDLDVPVSHFYYFSILRTENTRNATETISVDWLIDWLIDFSAGKRKIHQVLLQECHGATAESVCASWTEKVHKARNSAADG